MKKLISILVIFLFVANIPADAKMFGNKYDDLPTKYSKGITIDTNKKEVIKLLKNLTKYANKKDIEAIKKLYDKNYQSSDGFDYETYIKLTEETFKNYPNIKYDTRIDDIVVADDYAIVKMSDYTSVKINDDSKDKDKIGKLESICKYTTYLTKTYEGWKILYDNVEFEESALKFGDAKKANFRFDTPAFVENGKNYEIAFTATYPNDIYAMASIGNEEITYPDKAPKETFRKIKSDIPLERVVRANNNGHNEYAVASIGFTKVTITEDKSASLMNFTFQLSGMAFIMRRINHKENAIKLESAK